MERAGVVIIGAGVVGLAVGARLSRPGRSVYILEKHDSFGRETSSRSSEVIHAGIYYPAGSLKAKLCVKGNRLLYELCAKAGVNHRKISKLIVAVDENEEEDLEKLFKRGVANGVEGLELIDARRIKDLEPEVRARRAIYSPETGIIDTHNLMKYLAQKIKDNKGDLVYNSCVVGLRKVTTGYEIDVKDAAGDIFTFASGVVINSAGLESDTVAAMPGIDVDKEGYRLKYCKGQYFRVGNSFKCGLVRRLVYPVPHEKAAGLGVHVTKDLAGSLRLGPDTLYVARDKFDYEVDLRRRKDFCSAAAKFLPFLQEDDLTPDTAGIRPKLQGPDDDFRDFVINEESLKGFPGLVNLIGIESPGLTASLAIAEYVEGLLRL